MFQTTNQYIIGVILLDMLLGHIPKCNIYSYGHLSVISTYNPIYRMYNPIEITSYNW